MKQITFKNFIGPLIVAFIVGIFTDLVVTWDTDTSHPVLSARLGFGFFIFTPLFLFLFFLIISIFNIKNRAVITLMSIVVFFFIMAFVFWFFKFRMEYAGAYVGDMYELLYYFGLIPSIVIGMVFGLYISKTVNKP